MKRRDFLSRSARGLGAAILGHTTLGHSMSARAALLEPEPLATKFKASAEVVLGRTGIRTSRLAMGTGTVGYGGRSNQTQLGTAPLTRLLLDGYHDNGLRFFDSADSYGSHPYVAAALKQLPRDKVTVLTKTDTRDPAGVRDDLDRFRRELGVDYIDVVLIHCVTAADWTTRYRGVMDVLSEAKQKGVIRAHGVSCHSFSALKGAAASPWVEIDLSAIEPDWVAHGCEARGSYPGDQADARTRQGDRRDEDPWAGRSAGQASGGDPVRSWHRSTGCVYDRR